MYTLRPYQKEAVSAAMRFLTDKNDHTNALLVLSTGSGKSLIISDIADKLNDNVLVLQPSKEILAQNYAKMKTYTDECSIYSSSMGTGKKWHIVSKVTFATIGSIKNHVEDFKHFKYVLVDEAHGINSEEGMYISFLSMLDCKVLGLTATPYRLTAERYFDTEEKAMRTRNAQLTMLTNEAKPFFSKILYSVDTHYLVEQGFLASLKYFDARPKGWNEKWIYTNSNGSDYSENSIKWMMEKTDHRGWFAKICFRLLYPNSGIPRKGILGFLMFVEDAEWVTNELNAVEGKRVAAFVSGKTSKTNRDRILDEFRNGEIKVLLNAACFTTGLDVPHLDTVVLGRPTMSLQCTIR